MATITLGLEFAQPVNQTILPVSVITSGVSLKGMPAPVSAQIVGFFPITLTEFDGTETSFTLESGNVPVTSLRLPALATDNRVSEYLTASYSNADMSIQPWRGHPSFVPVEKAGYYSKWIMPVSGITYRHDDGVLIGNLSTQMNVRTWTPAAAPQAPTASDGTLKWAVSMSLTNDLNCSFFDFNWVELFQAKPPSGVDLTTINGLAIVPTTQPTGLPFKSTVLQHSEPGPNGVLVFNTVRIVRMLENIAAGDYAFGFTIVYSDQQAQQASTDVTLTVTIV